MKSTARANERRSLTVQPYSRTAVNRTIARRLPGISGALREVALGCLVRTVASLFLLLALAIGLRRATERPAAIPPVSNDTRDVVVEGVRWRSREAAGDRRPGDPVIFVHGFLSSSTTWSRVLVDSSAGRPAVAVDLPGAGFSDRPWPFDYTVQGQAEHLRRYLDARGFSRAVLVGNSLGGAVCEALAAAHPERVAALVLVDAAFPKMAIPTGFRLLRAPLVGEIQIELLVRPVIEYSLRRRLYARADRVTEATIDEWWDPIRVPGTRRAALEAVRSRFTATEALLARIRAPTLVLWGKQDRLMDPSEGLALATAIEGAQFVVLPGVGHLPQEEDPILFSKTVSAFLEQFPRAAMR
ncbi:MAG: alpha/beta hydrolase [Acidobacteriota bacterium]